MEKIAIIDIGSYSARIVIANIMDGGYFNVIDELKEPVSITQGMDVDGYLRPQRTQQLIKTLKTFKYLYESHKVDNVFAYITSAIANAKNKKSFLEETLTNSGIKLQVLTQEEEATLVYTGVINSLDIPRALICDIGGSTMKVIQYNRRVILNHHTFPFGAVLLSEKFGNITDGRERAAEIEKFVEAEFAKVEWLKEIPEGTPIIGVGGSMRNFGKISRRLKHYPLDMGHNYNIPKDEFENIYNSFKVLDISQPIKIKGISNARAEILPAAMSLLYSLFKFTGIDNMTVSCASLREGAMFRYAVPSTTEKPLSDILGHSIYTLLSIFNMNIKHSEHVFDISLQLYRQLKVLHKLPRNYVKVLRVAAQLHDIGSSYKFYDHASHSLYFIMHSALYGLTQKELIMAAIVAGMHDRVPLDVSSVQQYLAMLTPEEVDAVRKLSVIVRISECFDRSMSGVITTLNCDILGDSVILKTEATGDCSLEIIDAEAAVGDFKKAFKKNLDIL